MKVRTLVASSVVAVRAGYSQFEEVRHIGDLARKEALVLEDNIVRKNHSREEGKIRLHTATDWYSFLHF